MTRARQSAIGVRAALVLGFFLVTGALALAVGRLVDQQGPGGRIDWAPWLITVAVVYGVLLLLGWLLIRNTRDR